MKPSFRTKLHLRSWIVSGVLCYAIWDTYHRLTVVSSDAGTFFPILSLAVNMLLVGALWLCRKRLLAITHERAGEASSRQSEESTSLLSVIHQLEQEVGVLRQSISSNQASESIHLRGLDEMLEGCQIVGYDWTYIYLNDTASHHARRQKEDLIGHTMMEMYPGIESTEMFEKLWLCMQERIPQIIEHEFLFPDGRKGCFDLKFLPVPEGVFILSVDISERKKAEEQLRKSESMLTEIGKLANIGGWEIDVETMDMFWTEQTFTIYGLPQGQIPTIEEAIHFYAPSARPLITEAVKLGMEEGRPWDIEVPFITANGKQIWVRSLGKGEFRDGKCIRLMGAFQDITARKVADEAIRESHEQFRMISENIADMIAVLDLEGKRMYNSPSYRSLLGNPESLYGTDSFQEIHPEDRDRIRALFHDTVRTGIGQRAEYRFVLPDGSIRFIESQGSVIRDEEGAVIRVIVVSRDSTEKKQLEKQFLRAQRMESIGTLASGIAHDLNNVLSPILLSVSYLSTKLTDAQSQKMLQMLETSTKRGSALIRQVLSFARGVEGEFTIVQVRHLIEEIGKIITQTFPKSITFHTKYTTNLPTISADSTQIHQVLMNLCVNARDAMPNGGKIEIEAETIELDEQYVRMHLDAKLGTYIVITVTDQGMGIPPVVLERIFEPFFTTKEINKGTGLGLSTVLTIIKSHKGFINVYSELGKGTTFKLYLPVSDDGSRQAELDVSVALPHSKGECILIVEDEESIREITKVTLEAHGYKVLTAVDGTEALATYAHYGDSIALVVTDMMMPYMDGTATIRAIQKMNPQVKIIAVSGLKQDSDIVTQDRVVFLHKPYTSEKLLSIIGEMLRRV